MRLASAVAALILMAGCRSTGNSGTAPSFGSTAAARGVVIRQFARGSRESPISDALVIDVDLATPGARAGVVAGPFAVKAGRVFGESHTVVEWCRLRKAAAGVNGGFFGETVGARKELVGLAATDGAICSTGRQVRARGRTDARFVRSVLAFDSAGRPRIAWAVGVRGRAALLTTFSGPENPALQAYWEADSAVACGPRLIHDGRVRVYDREERLVSAPPLARTFAGYDEIEGAPRHLVLGVGSAMTFLDAARFLQTYMSLYHSTVCEQAMALDGGASSQLAYRASSRYVDARSSPVTVPSAILVSGPDNAP